MRSYLCFLLTGATAHSGAYFGVGSDMVHLTFVNCSGSEYDMVECETENVGINSSHSLDVGVKCQPGMLNFIYAQYVHQHLFLPLQLMKLTEREIFV